ncbi:MAG: hypothetical protein L0K86_15030 [Actinomycetia bacterium]|nr:hypothetical protein [Actinomycetes bacterium]
MSTWEEINPEPIGREAKLWLREPGAPKGSRERDWLFKPVVVASNGHRQGEDWAEKIVSELGALIGARAPRSSLRSGTGSRDRSLGMSRRTAGVWSSDPNC